MKFNEIGTEAKRGDVRRLTTPSSVFGFGLLASPAIERGMVTLVALFSNRTSQDQTIAWVNSHLFLVNIVDGAGDVFDVATILPPPIHQDPTILLAGRDFTIVYPVDTTQPPYAGKLEFRVDRSPYTFDFTVNASSHRFRAAVTLDVV